MKNQMPSQDEWETFERNTQALAETIAELAKTNETPQIIQALTFALVKTVHDHANGNIPQGMKFARNIGNTFSKTYRTLSKLQSQSEQAEIH